MSQKAHLEMNYCSLDSYGECQGEKIQEQLNQYKAAVEEMAIALKDIRSECTSGINQSDDIVNMCQEAFNHDAVKKVLK